MDPVVEYLAVTSTFSILIPITYCLLAVRKKAEKNLQLFLLFLLFGFFIDLIGWISYKAGLEGFMLKLVDWLYQTYPIVEAIFFFWIIGFFSNRNTLKTISKYSIWLTLPTWLFIRYAIGDKIVVSQLEVDVFPAVYRIICSFLATLSLLELIEHRQMKLLQSFRFWILAAILFYCFSTFVVLFLGKEIGQKLWYLHNTMNILTYLIYSVGFYIHGKYDQSL